MNIRTIFVATLAGTIAALVAVAPLSASFPGENGKIAFVRQVLTKDQIFTMSPDGSGQTRLGSKASDHWPSWTGDGAKIAFQSCCRKGRWQIWVMSSTGAGRVNVSNNTTSDTHPAFSPDGTRIAFVRSGQIWVMSAGGSSQTRLTTPSGYADDGPSWSPDGTKIAFQRCCVGTLGGGAYQVFAVNPAGGGETNVSGTWGATSDFQPDWSPDGRKIVFGRYDGTVDDRIWAMDANGANQTKLNSDANGGRPRYAPDGTKIVFEQGGNISTMTSTGASLTVITAGFEPAWQPIP